MKVLCVLPCLLAAVSAIYLQSPYDLTIRHHHSQDEFGQYAYEYSGGPSAKHETRTLDGVVRGGYHYIDAHGILQSANYVADPIFGFRVAATNIPVQGLNGPEETAEVRAAKTVLFAEQEKAKSLLSRKRRQIFNNLHYPVIDGNGVPIETKEVLEAKAKHAAAYAQAARVLPSAGNNQYYQPQQHHIQSYQQPQPQPYSHIPQPNYHIGQGPTQYATLGVDGRPVDTQEIAAAKAAHFQAHAEAQARNNVPGGQSYAHNGPQVHHTPAQYNYGHAAVPQHDAGLYTPEVAAARAAHFQAHQNVQQAPRPFY